MFHNIIILISLVLGFVGCASYEQQYIKGQEIHAKARKVAVLPLVNLTTYPNAGQIVTDLLITELYAMTDFSIMEQGKMIANLKAGNEDIDQMLEHIVASDVGKKLRVDTIIFGSVTEFRYKRGLDEDPIVGITIRLLDVNSGKILWAGSKSATGGCFWFCEDSLNRLANKVCHDLVKAMVKAG